MGPLRRLLQWWIRVRPAAAPPPSPPPLPAPGPAVTGPPPRKVTLRAERNGSDYRHLEAYLDHAGVLHIDGHDLGPGTGIVTDDGEYEWFGTIAAADVPRVLALLGGQPDDDILDLLERDYTGTGSYELEKRLRDSDITVTRHVW